MKEKTWEELTSDKVGTIYVDKTDGNLRYLVMRGPASLCAYIGVALDHPIAGKHYDFIDINVHGGLTFSQEGNGKQWPKGFFGMVGIMLIVGIIVSFMIPLT